MIKLKDLLLEAYNGLTEKSNIKHDARQMEYIAIRKGKKKVFEYDNKFSQKYAREAAKLWSLGSPKLAAKHYNKAWKGHVTRND